MREHADRWEGLAIEMGGTSRVACRGENVRLCAPPRVEWTRSSVDTSVNAARTSARATSAPRNETVR